MRLSLGDTPHPCRNCGREWLPSELDRRFWCPDCRAVVVRRSALIARVTALTVALGLTFWIYTLVGSRPQFMMIYIVMVVLAYFFVRRLTQRVAFEIIRARGVTPPPPSSDG